MWTVFVAFVVALVAGLLAGGIVPLMVIVAQGGGHFQSGETIREKLLAEVSRPAILLTSGAATQTMLLLTALSAAILSPVPVVRRLRLNPSSLSPFGYLVAPIGATAVSFLFAGLVALLKIPESGTLKLLGESIRRLSPIEVVAGVLIVGVMPGFAEEFVFRGYAQTRLVERWGRWPGIVIASALFGVMHLDLLQGTFAMGFGLYIGYVAEKARSIRPTMVCHAVNNSIQVFLGRFAAGSDPQTRPSQAALLALGALAVLVLCTMYIYFRVNPPVDDLDPALAEGAAGS